MSLLALVEEPEGHGERDGVEEVRPDRHHHVDLAVLDQLAADGQLGVAGVGGGVGHDEASPAGVVERRREDLDPQVVAVVDRRDPVGVALVVFDPVLVDGVDVERRIGDHEVEPTHRIVRVLVVGVRRDDLPSETVDRQVHLGQSDRLVLVLLAEDRDLGCRVLLVLLDEAGRLNKHAARPAGGVEDAALEWLDDVDDELDDRGRGEELAGAAALRPSRSCRGSIRRSSRRRRPSMSSGIDPISRSSSASKALSNRGVVTGQDTLEIGVLGLDGSPSPD